MLRGQLTTLLGLLSVAWLPMGSGRPGPRVSPPGSWAVANQTQTLDALVPTPALGSWTAFLSLQKSRQLGTRGRLHGQEVAAAMSLPLDPQEVAGETCKAVPFIQVLSRPGCMATRVHNHLCFGRCSSLYMPSTDPTPLVLCNSCAPTRRRRAPVVLWCGAGSPASPRRVKTFTVLVEGCQCSPKL